MKMMFKIDGFVYKIIACISLACWLFGAAFLSTDSSAYLILTIIGVTSYPILAYAVTEGFLRSSDLKKYIIRLTVLAVLSEPFYDLALNQMKVPEMFYSQNVVFTLVIGLIGLYFYDLVMMKYKDSVLKMNILRTLVMLSACIAAALSYSEYSYYGILMIFSMYIFKKDKVSMMIASSVLIILLGHEFMYFQILTLMLLFLYSGQEGRKAQKFFYAFYPALLALSGVYAYFLK